ncbi:CopD family protein [Streptomyces sp. NPDC127091]|uniref:CopD family protein n=1 Tax=Streptomyces sp. NPDC127091 TaxID=3347134 RepID=UPI003660B086
MTLTNPRPGAAGAHRGARRSGTGPAVAVLVLVALAALIPFLGPSPALRGTGEAPAPGTGGIALLRTVLFAALAIPVGELFVKRLLRSVPDAPPAVPRSWSTAANTVGFAAALGLASVVATGNLIPESLAAVDVGGLYDSRDGKLALLEVNAFLLAALCAASGRPGTQAWPLTAIIVAEALRAHPKTEYTPLLGSGLTLIHLTCASLWVGGLLYALRTMRAWRESEAGGVLLGLYARVAAVLLAAITATGVFSSLRRMPPGTILEQLTDTAYGRVLLAKVVLMAGVAALALWARVRLARAADPLSARGPAWAEASLLALVVAVSGLLTALPVPIRW